MFRERCRMSGLMYRVVTSFRQSTVQTSHCDSPASRPVSSNTPQEQDREQDIGWTPIKAVVFDMDGTLTKPTIEFVKMHERLKIPMGSDILVSVNAMSSEQKSEALSVIEELEKEANDVMELQPGVLELLDYLAEQKIERAIMTRNTPVSVDVLLRGLTEKLQREQHLFPNLSPDGFFSKIVTREFTPQKPHPAPVLHICEHWSISPAHIMVVGDHHVDITCGHSAGTVTAHLRNSDSTPIAPGSDINITSLHQLLEILKQPLELTRGGNIHTNERGL